MSRLLPAAASLSAAGALAFALGGDALGAPSPSADFGQHVATCAQEHAGQREGAPSVACTHDASGALPIEHSVFRVPGA